jgi:hypothetical protein
MPYRGIIRIVVSFTLPLLYPQEMNGSVIRFRREGEEKMLIVIVHLTILSVTHTPQRRIVE